jgi:hypothetical protein
MMRIAFVPLLVLTACAPVSTSTVAPQGDPHLLALLFDDARSIEAQLARDFACVSLRNGGAESDPSQAVIDQLSGRWNIPVFAGSRCRVVDDTGVVAAPGAAGSGKWLRVSNFECRDADHCTADVSYYVANLGAGGRTVAVERSVSGWRLTPTGPMWIS